MYMKPRLKRNYYRYPKYYYTALRFMVEIYRAPKPKNLFEYKFIKTQREYEIDAVYHLYKDDKLIQKIPVWIKIGIKSKNRDELKVQVPKPFYYYGVPIRKELREYFLNI